MESTRFYVRLWFTGGNYFAGYAVVGDAVGAVDHVIEAACDLYPGQSVVGINVRAVGGEDA